MFPKPLTTLARFLSAKEKVKEEEIRPRDGHVNPVCAQIY